MMTTLLVALLACATEPTPESFLEEYGDTLCDWQEECGGPLSGDACDAHYASLRATMCEPFDAEVAQACLDEIAAYTDTCEPETSNPSCVEMFC